MIFIIDSLKLSQKEEETEKLSDGNIKNSDSFVQPQKSHKIFISKNITTIPYIDSSDEEGQSKHPNLTKAQVQRIESDNNQDTKQMPINKNNAYSSTNLSNAHQNSARSILHPQKSEKYSQESHLLIKKNPIVGENQSLIEKQRKGESQQTQLNSRSQSEGLEEYTLSNNQHFQTVQSELDSCRKLKRNIKCDKIHEQHKKRSLISEKSELEEDVHLQSILLSDDEDELDNTTGTSQTRKGLLGVIGYISMLFEYIIWNVRRIIASPKYEIIVLTLCSGLLLYIFDLLSDIVNGMMLLYKGKTCLIKSPMNVFILKSKSFPC